MSSPTTNPPSTSTTTTSTSSSPTTSTVMVHPSPSSLFDPSATSERITLTYQDDFGVWKYVEPELKNHLPLKKISWKTKTGHTKIVELMPVDIIHYDDERLKQTFEFQNLYRKPYLYLYLVHCDETDIYKSTVKNKIKQWVTNMNDRQQEWLIIYVSLGQKSKSFLPRTVYDKIKNDFNVRRDRCCHLRFFDDSNKNEDLWEDMLFKVKEGIVSSAEQYLTTYEEEIRRSDARRTTAGWSYLSFFFLKESLALIYERALLYEEALLQYIELEVLFADNKSQFEKVALTPPMSGHRATAINESTDAVAAPPAMKQAELNDGVNLFDSSTRRYYRELIYQNRITLYDFKHYLFVRQSKLLFLLHRPIEVTRKAVSFITSVGYIIQKHPSSFKPYFYETWVFSVSMETIKACQEAFERLQEQTDQAQQITASSTRAKSTTPSFSRFLNGFGNLVTSIAPTTTTPAPATLAPPQATTGGAGGTGGRLPSSQSLTNVQSIQIQSAMGRTPSLSSLPDLEKQPDKQDREELDFMLADILFCAIQRLEELAIKLDMLPNDENLDFYKKADDMFNKTHKTSPASLSPVQSNGVGAGAGAGAGAASGHHSPSHVDGAHQLSPTILFTYPALQAAFQSIKDFSKLYLDLLNQSEKLYVQTNRSRSHQRLSYSLGNFHFKRGNFSEASTIFKRISNIYNREKWKMIEYAIKTKLAYCHKQLNELSDYITTCIGLLTPGLLKSDEEREYYLKEIFETTKNNQLNIATSMHPLFKAKLTIVNSEYRFLEHVRINLRIKSNLFCPIVASHGAINFIRSNNSNEKLIFNQVDFTINPGTNNYELTTIGTTKASFIKDSCWLKIGGVSFGQSLKDGVNGEIKIIETESSITLESFVPNSALLLCCVQYIGVRLHTHADAIERGVLSFQSPTSATIIQPPMFNILQRKSNGTVNTLQLPFVNEKIHLQQIGREEQLEFYIPVMAVNNDTCSHQITIELQHQKQTKEAFSSSLVSTALFISPFSVDQTVIPVGNRLFLKLMLQCSSSTPLVLSDYRLEECDPQYIEDASQRHHSFYLVKDHNESLRDMTLYPAHTISMIFEVNRYYLSDTKGSMKLCIKYINKLQDVDPLVRSCKQLWKDQVDYYYPIIIDCPEPLYRIDTNLPQKVYIGALVPYEFTISNIPKGTIAATAPAASSPDNGEAACCKDTFLTYQIEFDSSFWTISGHNKSQFKLNPDDQKPLTFKINLIPIGCGALPTPKVTLIGVNPSSILYSKASVDQIYVYPSSHFNSACDQIGTSNE
ncbi:hypothetical protein SAMD00019534_088240 [Acytostelium subglobosum LB1]|uniref:hypothetical protein n=1 Tax=Acytostelium subglobosum LB1 TaxID=1410327 RepID=UPI000644F5A5|nr:hypothetical protein SAMD00019534_088240 [Acytostelium subglobosum LB1]GAM25649.1 hypothetical protein SAMD00019534_088240 [Acytostelium subglobosum LB1]|eukprot:XP_012751635.1 hypothetical protein SAMD00019534_088240 [Acytostelium subglobosum LB1]